MHVEIACEMAKCDYCGAVGPIGPCAESIDAEAVAVGWTVYGNNHLCPICSESSDEFLLAHDGSKGEGP